MTYPFSLILATCSGALLACAGAPQPGPAPVPAPAPIGAVQAPTATPAPAPVRASTSLQSYVDSLVGLPQFANAHWGILIVAPDRRDTLASVQPDRLVMPASNQKLITGAVALARLGAAYQWQTTFLRTGPIIKGVLRGDLVIVGTGDPSVSTAMRGDPLSAFDSLVTALRASGVTRIAGHVRSSDGHAFPGSPLGFGWDWDDLDAPYGAGVAELMFNDSFTDVQVHGCRAAGRAACVTTTPARTAPVIRSQVVIRAKGTGVADLNWWRDSAATPGIVVRGSIASGDSVQFSAAQPDVRGSYVAAVREALIRSGIQVADRSMSSTGSDTIAVLRSAPLRDVLKAMQKPSQNQIAEALFRTLGLEATGVGTPDSARAVVERQLDEWGVRRDAHAIRDGSGLSRHDYLTPRAIVQVLDTMRRSATFPVFHESLPAPGEDGTLKNRMQRFAERRVRAKTGTIDKARALSGFATTSTGELIVFSIVANNFTVANREVDRIAELIVERLVTMRGVTP